ncbi:helix-turn-helix domain-containing protein [Streptomyces sp. S.PNR 29]|uniref:AraC-like ligand-binding domain-containing protein n=1 Tax=Streptomyces sp. S.PNR 29 TaxID=2973805 RepID=UPI0025B1FCC6|nr:helix-turn-helix domain-containing protein [Streptomyces sp. S.PNR 29]MDN0196956.1 helix-turn-helix domain-containing protein [Streptomyces sp. S.PNR 29]
MLVQEFRTEVVPTAERWDLWQDVTSRTHVPNLLRSDDEDDFRATLRLLPLGEAQISLLAFPHLEIVRTQRAIRRFDPEAYQIQCLLEGECGAAQSGREAAVHAGDLVLVDTSLPYEARHIPSPGPVSSVVVTLPRAMLPLPPRAVRRLLAAPVPLSHGMGGVLYRWLTDVAARADEFTEADVPTLASVTTDLLASVLGRCLEAEDTLAPESRRRALHTRIRDFIDQHLTDPSLSPALVAAAHGISVRYLHQLFAEEGETPAAWIRHRRLERCRRDLADPRLQNRSIQSVAARWGFPDPATFSRAFRRAYGMTPRDYRHHT